MRRWFRQYCYKKALTSCKNVPWLKLSWSEPPTGSSFSATHDWNWYWAYYQAANRALRSTGGTLAPERSLPRIAARSGTNCDVTNLSRSSRSPVSRPLGRWASLPIVISGGDNRRYHPLPICVSSYKRDGPLFEVLISWFPTHSRPCFNSSRPCVSCSHAAVPRYQFVISGGDRDPYRPPPPRSPAYMTFSQVTPVCRSQKLLTSQATTLVTRDSEPPYPTDAVSAFDGKVFVRDVTVT